ncbi:hypothetical protein Focb16_v002264 [Fusarium oxysporum f. sp. cubense]|uniref:Fungal N-terminal domain-containing protein n=1 Tax=Fusarium oxysporum f. sp. cubense TaxID=61366 RepID=A0A559L3W1_FUSOC|nr:hypothetical protein Focb16_v002264 [Fusarium oxysporum f. sp. cubense]
MADPLSVASGVAGLISLGLTLCGGLHNYFSAVRDRHQDIETAAQSLALLQSNLFIIQSSTLKLGHRHALSANGVNQGLANCESQLVTLQQMMLDLTRNEGLSTMKGKLRKQMTIARYPFDQKKLSQLQAQLYEANATLSNFVQNFNLDINIGISEDLRVLKNYTNANDSITHNMLGTIARRLDTISPVVQRTEMEVAKISRYVQENPVATRSRNPDDVAKPRYLQNSQKEEKVVKRLNDLECTCTDPSSSSIRRQTSYVNRSWVNLVISKEQHTRQRHRPGCIFFSHSLQTSKTTFTYLGLRYWFSRVLSMALTRDYPTGAYSLSFGIQSCNVVESSPAFQAIHDLKVEYHYGGERHHHCDIQEVTAIVIKKLGVIYSSGAASPFDVDDNGNNIAHVCMDFYRNQLQTVHVGQDTNFEAMFELTCSLLFYMFDIGVPITTANFYQQTILYHLCAPHYLSTLPAMYNFIEKLDRSFCVEDVANSETRDWICTGGWDFKAVQVWDEYPEIAEAFGFNDVFRTVMQRDGQKLAALTMNNQLPTGMLETDVYGRNILHASIVWPEGLGLLLQQSLAVSALCDNESVPVSPLELAIDRSWTICPQADKWVLCQNCDCTVSAQVLLEADCCLPVHFRTLDDLKTCSLRCRRLFFKHLENRRRRLRDLSLAWLPSEVNDRYGVTVDSIPDATAAFLWDELQSRSDELRRQGCEISSGLKPCYSNNDLWGLFERLQPPEICSLADEFGIRPTDESGIEPLLARVEVLQFTTLGHRFDAVTTYLDWLMNHDLKLECVRGGFQTSALHNFGGRIGRILCRFLGDPDPKPPYLWKREGIGLITKICNSDIESNLPCPCVSGVFNRPLASLFSAFSPSTTCTAHWRVKAIGKICLLVDLIQSIATSVDTSYLARCAVHRITMELLRIRHVEPCAWIDSSPWWVKDPWDEEERVKVLDEDRILLKKLGDLDEEFEQEFQDRNESVVDFLQGYYATRMEEVVREMAEPVGDDYRRGLLAAGVILEEPESDFRPPWMAGWE